MNQDFYEVLGVSRDADSAAIRNAFKKLALTHHPDKVAESQRAEAEVQFKIISEAYETLSNEETRILYDASAEFNGHDWQDFYTSPTPDFFDFGSHVPPTYENSHGSYSKRTEDAVFEIELTLEEVFKGKMLKLKTQRQILCRRCQGTGGRKGAQKRTCNSCKGFGTQKKTHIVGPGLYRTSTVMCDICHGDCKVFSNRDLCRRCKGGKVQKLNTMIEVYVPKGVKNRHGIVVEGQADEEPGKQTGNLLILILVNEEHPVFCRKGADLYAIAQITLKEALTGFSRGLITHMDGRTLKTTVPRGDIIKPGSIIRIPGEGLVVESTTSGVDEVGDMYLQVDIEFPDSMDRHILDELATLLNPSEDDNEDQKSDDTLDDSGFSKDSQRSTTGPHGAQEDLKLVEIDYELIEDGDLPEYAEDPNSEPEPQNTKFENTHSFGDHRSEDPWGAHTNGAIPGCRAM